MKTIALHHANNDYVETLISQFRQLLPMHHIIPWQADRCADYLLSWKPDPKIFSTSGVKVIFALGAGVDAFLAADLPDGVPLVRLEEAGMGKQMLEIALYGILHHSRDMIALNQGQRDKQWLSQSTPKRIPFSTPVGIMGLGQLGGFIAQRLAELSYPVNGYSRSLKSIDHVTCYDDSSFERFLTNSEVLINLLPLTAQTENILNAELFAKLPQGAFIINIARGKHLVEADLMTALDSGHLSGALLDVFRTEPLPTEHPFWLDNRIIVLPHLAAITLQSEAVAQISKNILAFEAGHKMTGVVNRRRGY